MYRVSQKSKSTLNRYSVSNFRSRNILKKWNEAKFLSKYENYEIGYFAYGIREKKHAKKEHI